MLTIVKDKEKKIVSNGAFESFYKPLGYEIVTGTKSVEKKEVKPVTKENEKKEYDVKSDRSVKNEKKDSSK